MKTQCKTNSQISQKQSTVPLKYQSPSTQLQKRSAQPKSRQQLGNSFQQENSNFSACFQEDNSVCYSIEKKGQSSDKFPSPLSSSKNKSTSKQQNELNKTGKCTLEPQNNIDKEESYSNHGQSRTSSSFNSNLNNMLKLCFQSHQQNQQLPTKPLKMISKQSTPQQKLLSMLVEPRSVAAGLKSPPKPTNGGGELSLSYSRNNNNSSNFAYAYSSPSTAAVTTKNSNRVNNSKCFNSVNNNLINNYVQKISDHNYSKNEAKNLSHIQSSNISTFDEVSPFRKTCQSQEIKYKPLLTEGNTGAINNNWMSILEQKISSSVQIQKPSIALSKQFFEFNYINLSLGSSQDRNEKVGNKGISNSYFQLSSFNKGNNTSISPSNQNFVRSPENSVKFLANSSSTPLVSNSINKFNEKNGNFAQILIQQVKQKVSQSRSKIKNDQTPNSQLITSFKSNNNTSQLLANQNFGNQAAASFTFSPNIYSTNQFQKVSSPNSQGHQKNSKSMCVTKNSLTSNHQIVVHKPISLLNESQLSNNILFLNNSKDCKDPSFHLIYPHQNQLSSISQQQQQQIQQQQNQNQGKITKLPTPKNNCDMQAKFDLQINQNSLLPFTSTRDQQSHLTEKQKNKGMKLKIEDQCGFLSHPILHQVKYSPNQITIDDSIYSSNVTTNCRTNTCSSYPPIKINETNSYQEGENTHLLEEAFEEFAVKNKFNPRDTKLYFHSFFSTLKEVTKKIKENGNLLQQQSGGLHSSVSAAFLSGRQNGGQLFKSLDQLIEILENPIMQVFKEQEKKRRECKIEKQLLEGALEKEKREKKQLADQLIKLGVNAKEKQKQEEEEQKMQKIETNIENRNESYEQIIVKQKQMIEEQNEREKQLIQLLLFIKQRGINIESIHHTMFNLQQNQDNTQRLSNRFEKQKFFIESLIKDSGKLNDHSEAIPVSNSPRRDTISFHQENSSKDSKLRDAESENTSSGMENESDVLSIPINETVSAFQSNKLLNSHMRDKLKINLKSLNINNNLQNNLSSNTLNLFDNLNQNNNQKQQSFEQEEIYGYHDEFMNRFDEFSQSWRDAILAERRYPQQLPQPIAHVQHQSL